MCMIRWFGLVLFALSCHAQTVITLLNNGSSANRVDMVIVGDGYTLGERTKFESDANDFVNKYFLEQPYLTYKTYFNVHALFVASNQSGADHPERSVAVDTAFDATYNCSNIQRLICVNFGKVTNAMIAGGVQPNMRDISIVLVNDSEYGGSGGATAVTSTHPQAAEIILHEVGHTFGLLADEYSDSPPECNLSFEPSQVNATRENTRDNMKWKTWIAESTTLPTTGTQQGVPGAYQGAHYCVSGKYRPTYDSKMRSLGRPWDQINSEQLIKRIYNLVSPIDGTSPAAGTVTGNRAFSVMPIVLPLNTQWTIDGKSAGSGTGLLLSGADNCPHQVSVTVSDPTAMVRNDSSGILRKSVNWTYYPAALESPQANTTVIYNAAAGAGMRAATPDSWVTLKGSSLAKALNIPPDLRTDIDGVNVVVTDSSGVERLARLQFVSPGQINFVLPPTTALGTASIRVCRPGASTAATTVNVARVAPGLFAANQNGDGKAAAYVVRVKPDGSQSQDLVAAEPISPRGDTIYLALYGTGLRNPSVEANTKVTIGGILVPLLFAGPQGQFDALDQVNVGPLPASVMTPGLKDIVIEVDGIQSNIVQVEFR